MAGFFDFQETLRASNIVVERIQAKKPTHPVLGVGFVICQRQLAAYFFP